MRRRSFGATLDIWLSGKRREIKMAPPRLDSRHHTLIQALMNRGPHSDSDAKSLHLHLFDQDAGFQQCIGVINKAMDFVHMEIRASRNQYDGVVYYGIVNKLGNEQAKLGTRYSHAQIAFFKAVLEAIILEPSSQGLISSMNALNLRLEPQNEHQTNESQGSQTPTTSWNLTLAQKEKTLAELVLDKWLSRTDDGKVTLGVRTFLELWSIFKNFDVPFCDVCNEAGIKAQSCSNEDCNARMHEYCIKRKFHRPNVPKVCPTCGTDWDCSGLQFDLDSRVDEEESARVRAPQVSEDVLESSPVPRKPRSRKRM